MFASDQYELVDFGDGRKLERFGPYLLDRPSPAADCAARRLPRLWMQADARYDLGQRRQGRWSPAREMACPWTVSFESLKLELKLADSGQVGVFPEQADNWRWIAESVRRAGAIKVLNLFAYTGAATLVAAAAGAEVVHVDASTSAVAWARRNTSASKLGDAPVRWIVEDAATFVRREFTRGNVYDAVILDPPAYGHGPQGQSWQLERDLGGLLAACVELCRGQTRFLLLACHSGRLAFAGELLDLAQSCLPRLRASGAWSSRDLLLASQGGGQLHCGAAVRWTRQTTAAR